LRKPVIAGNWKMNKRVSEAVALVREIKKAGSIPQNVEVVVCPPFVSLSEVAKELKGSNIKLGAQNMHWEKSGAYTGEISPVMLKEIGCEYVIIGHSERRNYFCEDDAMVNQKVLSALIHGLKPIICVGENIDQRDRGETEVFVSGQVKKAVEGVEKDQAEDLVIAYEPIWAIGTGRSADSDEANRVIAMIRKTLEDVFDANIAGEIRIQYGGSVKPDNIREFMEMPEIDGALVGGASLQAESFYKIITYDR